jgi:hypothetical protein
MRLAMALIALCCMAEAARSASFDGSAENDAEAARRNGFGVMLKITAPWHGQPTKVRIRGVMKRSAADQVGLRTDDEILSVDGKAVGDVPVDQVPQLFRGAAGTPLTMVVLRNGKESTITYNRALPSSLPDDSFGKRITQQYDAEQRRQRLIVAGRRFITAAEAPSALQKLSPTLEPSVLAAATREAHDVCSALGRSDYRSALRPLRLLVGRIDKYPEARMLYALILDDSGRFNEAEDQLKTVVATDDKSLDALLALAACERSLGYPKEAIEYLRKCTALCATPSDEQMLRANITALQEEVTAQSGK